MSVDVIGRKRDSLKSKSGDGEKQEIWSYLLDNASKGKRLPEKSLIVMGGSPELQEEFLYSLRSDQNRLPDRSAAKRPPLGNRFAVGFTYEDVLDVDQEDVLARLSIHLLADESASFTNVLKPAFTPESIPNTLLVVLLDWNTPWHWLQQLMEWLKRIKALLLSLNDECQNALEENMKRWRGKGRTVGIDSTVLNQIGQENRLGPGEWDEPLGLPISVVCQNTDKMTMLQNDYNWGDDDFDFVLQCLRTVLLKHGGSLIYTMPDNPGALQTLIHSSLGIQSLLQKKEIKPIHFERDRIVIPSNWDTWGKIRVLREELFDIEGFSKAWSMELNNFTTDTNNSNEENHRDTGTDPTKEAGIEESAIEIYRLHVKGPRDNAAPGKTSSRANKGIEVESISHQKFLEGQLKVIEKLKVEDEKNEADNETKKTLSINAPQNGSKSQIVEDQIGPVQFNVGGIQVDAEDMVRKLKDREASRKSDTPSPAIAADGKSENEALASFFSGLMKRSGNSSANTTPTKPS